MATDWSKTGIGYWLSQKHCECKTTIPFCCRTGWKTTLIGSRFTHPAESRYAPIEGEALAVADALNKARYFVLGCPDLIIAVDHKPLLKIFGNRNLEDIPNARIRNLKEKTLRYRFRMEHIPGVKHKAADATSRQPAGCRNQPVLTLIDDTDDNNEALTECDNIEESLRQSQIAVLKSIQSVTWDRVKLATNSNTDFQELLALIEDGIPEDKDQMPHNIQEFYKFREDLYSVDGVIVYKSRIVIPPVLRREVVDALHSAHQGVTSMIARAESSVFWPGITNDIIERRKSCYYCNRMAPSLPSLPPFPQQAPEYPFQKVCADYFHYKRTYYLVIVDRYSNWPIIERAQEGANGLIALSLIHI